MNVAVIQGSANIVAWIFSGVLGGAIGTISGYLNWDILIGSLIAIVAGLGCSFAIVRIMKKEQKTAEST